MEEIKARDVAAILKSVSTYGGKISSVFHNYSLIADQIPYGFEGTINILDATNTTLTRVLNILQTKAESGSNIDGKVLLNNEGLKYVQLLALECATALAKIEPAVDEASLDGKERRALEKEKRRLTKRPAPPVNPLALSLDEEDFLERIEKTKWSRAVNDIDEAMERLYELQLHLLLVFQVASVSALSTTL